MKKLLILTAAAGFAAAPALAAPQGHDHAVNEQAPAEAPAQTDVQAQAPAEADVAATAPTDDAAQTQAAGNEAPAEAPAQ